MRYLPLFIITLLLASCKNEDVKPTLKNGTYRAVLSVQDNEDLPFLFEVTSPQSLIIFNAEERIEVDEVEYRNDSIL